MKKYKLSLTKYSFNLIEVKNHLYPSCHNLTLLTKVELGLHR